MSDTVTYQSTALPEVTVTRTVSAVTGRKMFRSVVSILEIDPSRSVTAEERAAGITALNPPTVIAMGTNALLRRSVQAACVAYESTPGFSFDGQALAGISHRVSHSLLQALRKLGEDV